MKDDIDTSLVAKNDDYLIRKLNTIVVWCVKILAVLMTIVIIWGVIDVIYHLCIQTITFSPGAFNIENMVSSLGNFLAVLIAIEIFMNIIFYLKKDTLHVQLVLATALTAVARKVIVFDFATYSPNYLYAIAASIVATGIAYWLVNRAHRT
jgi:uncharacterized membrane protein (DUF373 family)